jgi:hypothetical protein
MDSKMNNNQINLYLENNSINEELETKWKEIEQTTKQKISKADESKKLNNLNDFSIMRIDLNSLIHPMDDSSEFEDYCQLKIKQLEKIKQSFDNSHNNNMNIITFGLNKPDNINTNNSSIKSFLKEDNENETNIKKNWKYSLNDIIEINRNKNQKKKLDFKNILDMMDNNDNNPNSFENRNIKGNQPDNNSIFNRFNAILSQKRPTFLKSNDDKIVEQKNNIFINTQKNKPSYHKFKYSFDSNAISTNNYRMNKNKNNNMGIKSKIEDNYNYLYSLYPNIKRKYNNKIK